MRAPAIADVVLAVLLAGLVFVLGSLHSALGPAPALALALAHWPGQRWRPRPVRAPMPPARDGIERPRRAWVEA